MHHLPLSLVVEEELGIEGYTPGKEINPPGHITQYFYRIYHYYYNYYN